MIFYCVLRNLLKAAFGFSFSFFPTFFYPFPFRTVCMCVFCLYTLNVKWKILGYHKYCQHSQRCPPFAAVDVLMWPGGGGAGGQRAQSGLRSCLRVLPTAPSQLFTPTVNFNDFSVVLCVSRDTRASKPHPGCAWLLFYWIRQ